MRGVRKGSGAAAGCHRSRVFAGRPATGSAGNALTPLPPQVGPPNASVGHTAPGLGCLDQCLYSRVGAERAGAAQEGLVPYNIGTIVRGDVALALWFGSYRLGERLHTRPAAAYAFHTAFVEAGGVERIAVQQLDVADAALFPPAAARNFFIDIKLDVAGPDAPAPAAPAGAATPGGAADAGGEGELEVGWPLCAPPRAPSLRASADLRAPGAPPASHRATFHGCHIPDVVSQQSPADCRVSLLSPKHTHASGLQPAAPANAAGRAAQALAGDVQWMRDKWRETMARMYGAERRARDAAEPPDAAAAQRMGGVVAELRQLQAAGGLRPSPRRSPRSPRARPGAPAPALPAPVPAAGAGDGAAAAAAAEGVDEAGPSTPASGARGADDGAGAASEAELAAAAAAGARGGEGRDDANGAASEAGSAGRVEPVEPPTSSEPAAEARGEEEGAAGERSSEAALPADGGEGLGSGDGAAAGERAAAQSGGAAEAEAAARPAPAIAAAAQGADGEPCSPPSADGEGAGAGAAPDAEPASPHARAAAGPAGPGPGSAEAAAAARAASPRGSPRVRGTGRPAAGPRAAGREGAHLAPLKPGGRPVSRALEPELAEADGRGERGGGAGAKGPASPRSSLDSPRSEADAESVYSAESSPRRLDAALRSASRLGRSGARGARVRTSPSASAPSSAPSSPRGERPLRLTLRPPGPAHGALHAGTGGPAERLSAMSASFTAHTTCTHPPQCVHLMPARCSLLTAASLPGRPARGDAMSEPGLGAAREREAGAGPEAGAAAAPAGKPGAPAGEPSALEPGAGDRRFIKRAGHRTARDSAGAAAADHAAAAHPALPGARGLQGLGLM